MPCVLELEIRKVNRNYGEKFRFANLDTPRPYGSLQSISIAYFIRNLEDNAGCKVMPCVLGLEISEIQLKLRRKIRFRKLQ